MRSISVVAIALAGVIHLVITPFHYDHAPAHGIFFAVAGIAEILWALAFWRRPSLRSYYIGLAVAGGLVVLWGITRALPAPFGHGPEPIEALGVVCKLSELIGLSALIMLALQGRLTEGVKRPAWRTASEALTLALVLGLASWGIGYAATPWLPTLGPQEAISHEGHVHDHEAPAPATEAHLHGESSHEAEDSDKTVTLGALRIKAAWARPGSVDGTSAVYLTVSNAGEATDALIAAQSEVAQAVELHQTRMMGDVMQMQPVERVEVPARGWVELTPGGYHIMLIGLRRELRPGERFPISLRFEQGGEITIDVEVRQP
ncbi:MAG: copper chaperone PCu(A)C [Anaerolineae bacterium]|nr:copper chaperone PCu(A)C [Anaerolineae bacterium]MDW8098946.1 copper chaperone PCu(A)C [Anaerolineae bacterium]